MVAFTDNCGWPSFSNGAGLVNDLKARLGMYFQNHPEVRREAFLVEAVRRELWLREQAGLKASRRVVKSPRPVPKELDITAIATRLADLSYRRHGIWPRLLRSTASTTIGQWLGLRAE